MRIAFLVDSFPCLSETFILNQLTGLIDLGHDVTIFAGLRGPLDIVHDDVAAYGLLDRTHYFGDIPGGRIPRFRKFVPLFLRYLPVDPAVCFRTVNLFRSGREALSLRPFHRAVFLLRSGPFDVLQCHFGTNGLIGASLKEAGIPGRLVTMFHGYDIRRGVREGGQIYRRLFRRGDCFLAISLSNREYLIRLGADPDKVREHPVGIDLDRFDSGLASANDTSKQDAVHILTVARLVKEKGLDDGIRAVAGLLHDKPALRIRYRIVGDGPEKPRLLRLAEELKVGDAVTFSGWQKQGDVLAAMRQAHLFFLPSREEVLPVALMEALASGLPVVATAVGSVSEIVQDGISGYLVPSGDVVAMMLKLQELSEYRERRREMGAKGRAAVAERFDIRKLNKRLVEIYEILLSGKSVAQ
ncbi:MAG: glycosyltransferase [Thermodesulfobacteriota bacterium]